jgi:DNA-binding MarR family transcriptional regulator
MLTCQFNLQDNLFICYPSVTMPRNTVDTAVTDLVQAIGKLARRLRAESASHGLSWTESVVMARLARGGPATTADLARAEGMKPQSMGATISALEEMGLVERKPHPTDGRQMNIELTARGESMRKSAKDAKRTWLALAITRLDEQERETLFAAGEIIRRLAES